MTTRVRVTNLVSSHSLTTSFFVDEPIQGVSLELLTPAPSGAPAAAAPAALSSSGAVTPPSILVISDGANGAAATMRAAVTSGSNLTFHWDFGDGAAYRTQQEDG